MPSNGIQRLLDLVYGWLFVFNGLTDRCCSGQPVIFDHPTIAGLRRLLVAQVFLVLAPGCARGSIRLRGGQDVLVDRSRENARFAQPFEIRGGGCPAGDLRIDGVTSDSAAVNVFVRLAQFEHFTYVSGIGRQSLQPPFHTVEIRVLGTWVFGRHLDDGL